MISPTKTPQTTCEHCTNYDKACKDTISPKHKPCRLFNDKWEALCVTTLHVSVRHV